jgi:hypothetical protein
VAVKDVDPAPTQPLGRPDEACPNCGAPMAADQRYCLQCGTRRGESRVPEAYLAPPAAAANGSAAATRDAAPARQASDPSPLGAVLGIALLGGMLLIGVLLGRGEDETVTTTTVTAGQQASAAAPPAAAGGGETAAPLVSEWPTGTDGWTVQLQTLPKAESSEADVAAAKDDLAAGGVPDASVLDSDLYPSLPAGNWVLYSGVYTSKGDANQALDGLSVSAPDAEVVEVSQSGSGGDGEGSTSSELPSDDRGDVPAEKTEDLPSANGGGAVAPEAETIPPGTSGSAQDEQ